MARIRITTDTSTSGYPHQGTCTPDLLSAAKLPDLFCGPHGGVCTRADKFSDALEINAARAPQPAGPKSGHATSPYNSSQPLAVQSQ